MRRILFWMRFLPSAILLLGIVTVEGRLALPLFSALLIHECGHICTMAGLFRLSPAASGFRLFSKSQPSYRGELLIAAAGPLCNLLCTALLWRTLPALSFFSLTYGLCNLLPIGTLDGGRMLSSILHIWLPSRVAYYLWRTVSLLFFCLILFFSLWMLLFDGFFLGLLPLLFSLLPELGILSDEAKE
ncbi:MAG: hypothetical protein IJW71_02050 [Clostridia bacterium]|nr:hypothetical protein [Clostridia bacterium]